MKKTILLFAIFWGIGQLAFAQNQAQITRSDSAGCGSLTVNFGATIISGTATSYNWNFGDGNTSTAQNPTHTYTNNGTFYPFVVINFATGGNQTLFFAGGPIQVGAPDIFGTRINGPVCGPDLYSFSAFIDSSLQNATFEWILTYPNGDTSMSNQQFPTFDMNQVGTYNAQFKTFVDPGCQDSQSISVVVDTLAFNPVITNASCGNNDGEISIFPSGGTGGNPPLITWSTGDSSFAVSNLSPGFYTVNANYGPNFTCQTSDSFEIVQTGVLDYSISKTDVGCEQDSTGEIDITINASAGPVTFNWSTGAISEDLSNLTGGTYTVIISDTACSFTEAIDIDGDSLDVSFNATNADCSGNGGSLEVLVNGGQAPYTFAWSNGVTTSLNSNLSAGGYSVVVTDSGGCTDREVTFVDVEDTCEYVISGRVFFDYNGNCLFDGNDFYISGGWVNLMGTGQASYLDVAGNYSFSVPSGNYTIAPSQNSFPYFSSVCPVAGQYDTLVSNSDIPDLDFAMQNDTNLIDLAVSVTNTVIRPGFNHTYFVRVHNFGAVPMSGLLTFSHDPLVTFLNSNPTATNYNSSARTAIWNFSNLLPGRTLTYQVEGTISASTSIGTLLDINADVGPITQDVDPSNNTLQRVAGVVGSYDPNDKQVFPEGDGPEGFIEPTDNVMRYTIRFQNTGNFPAEFVVLRDTLDANLRFTSIKALGASHAYTMTLDGNALEVRFDNINLPDSLSDPEGSQGHFSFAVAHEGTLAPLTEIRNTAAIYFDFNAPIITNTVLSTIAEPSSSQIPEEGGILIYPNPSRGLFHINAIDLKVERVEVRDLTGRLVLQSHEQSIDLSRESAGIYILKVQTSKGIKTRRISLRK